jgi:hypothetical protein
MNPSDAEKQWNILLAELSELHARLIYLRLLLRLGVRG